MFTISFCREKRRNCYQVATCRASTSFIRFFSFFLQPQTPQVEFSFPLHLEKDYTVWLVEFTCAPWKEAQDHKYNNELESLVLKAKECEQQGWKSLSINETPVRRVSGIFKSCFIFKRLFSTSIFNVRFIFLEETALCDKNILKHTHFAHKQNEDLKKSKIFLPSRRAFS